MASNVFSPTNVSENPKVYRALWICGAVIIGTTTMLTPFTWDVLMFQIDDVVFNVGPTVLDILIILIALSIKQVRAEESGGGFFYGMALKRLKPGPHFVPIGLMQIRRVPRSVREFQCPDEPDKVFKGDDKEALPEGMVRAIRVLTGKSKGGSGGLLDTQMTITVSFYFQYAIDDIFDFVSNFAGDTVQVEKQLRDIGESMISGIASQETPETFNDKQGAINETLATEVRDRFQNSGVRIISARLISPDVSHNVSTALASVPIARAGAQTVVIAAEAEKTRRTKVREGDADGELAWLNAQAKGRKEMMEALKVDGNAVLASEAVRELSDKTDVLVVGAEGGMKDVMGLVKGAQSALNIEDRKGVTS